MTGKCLLEPMKLGSVAGRPRLIEETFDSIEETEHWDEIALNA